MLKKKTHRKRSRGFTLIEIIVVMAVLAILVLLAAPRFIGQTKEAQFTKHINNAKVLEDASERYYIDHGKWPRGDEEPYTPEEVASYAERIYDLTGEEITLDEGDYWDIDYDAMTRYAKLPDETERANFVLRNPVGKVYYLDGLTEEGASRLPDEQTPVIPEEPEQESEPEEDILATHGEIVAVHGDGGQSRSLGFSSIKSGTYYPNDAARERTWTVTARSTKDITPTEDVRISTYNKNGTQEYTYKTWLSKYSSRTWQFYVGKDTAYIRVEGSPRYATGVSVSSSGSRPTNYNLTATSTSNAITFNWKNMDSAIFYDGSGKRITESTGTAYTRSGLAPDTLYTFDIVFKRGGTGQRVTFQMKTKPAN